MWSCWFSWLESNRRAQVPPPVFGHFFWESRVSPQSCNENRCNCRRPPGRALGSPYGEPSVLLTAASVPPKGLFYLLNCQSRVWGLWLSGLRGCPYLQRKAPARLSRNSTTQRLDLPRKERNGRQKQETSASPFVGLFFLYVDACSMTVHSAPVFCAFLLIVYLSRLELRKKTSSLLSYQC